LSPALSKRCSEDGSSLLILILGGVGNIHTAQNCYMNTTTLKDKRSLQAYPTVAIGTGVFAIAAHSRIWEGKGCSRAKVVSYLLSAIAWKKIWVAVAILLAMHYAKVARPFASQSF
jgi:hypothetical protein